MSKKHREFNDPGTGTSYSFNSKRIINKDGSFNVTKSGFGYSARNTYQVLIGMSWTKFLLSIILFLCIVNALFALCYLAIGVEQLGIKSISLIDDFLESYFFSFQTFTTVGYGTLSPMGKLMNIVASIESVAGWMCFAIVTGILYGRFSKPSAMLKYSEKAIVGPYKNGLNSLQFRVANMRQSNLMEMEATVILMHVKRDSSGKGILKRSFTPLTLERNNILFFPLNWTLVHLIDENSPFYNKSRKELEEMEIEILTLIRGFDDTFSNVVHSRHSYKLEEIHWGGKFKVPYETQENGEIILFYEKLDEYENIDLDHARN